MRESHALRAPRPAHVLAVTVAYLVGTWGLFLAVDAANVAGSRERLDASALENPATWFLLFEDGGPTEVLQWLLLGAAGLLAAVVGGRHLHSARPPVRDAAMFWLVMSVALILMLIEDAGNPRHEIRWWAERIGGSERYERAAEYAFFAALAAPPAFAALRYGRRMWRYVRTRWYLLFGFAVYGAAAVMSATRYGWYTEAGSVLHRAVGGELLRVDEYHQPTEFWLMDSLVEESVELVGAALMLSGVLAFLREAPPGDPSPPSQEGSPPSQEPYPRSQAPYPPTQEPS